LANPRQKAKPLQGNGKNFFSSRVGEARIIFKVHNSAKAIEIVRVDYRGGSYKKMKNL
jgi:mRNA-degrading endonuclease RelE of RelBE toxin-antitoxin system